MTRLPRWLSLPALLFLPSAAFAMDFAAYIHLQEGMTEAELIARAGPPDQSYFEGNRVDEYAWQAPWLGRRSAGFNMGGVLQQEAKAAVYNASPGTPYLTVVHLVGGRIAAIERIRQF